MKTPKVSSQLIKKLRKEFKRVSQTPTRKIVIACRDDGGNFFGGRLLRMDQEGKMLIKNKSRRLEPVSQTDLTWLLFQTKQLHQHM